MAVLDLTDAKSWLGIDEEDTQDDARLAGLLLAVLACFEEYAQTALIVRTFTQRFEGGETGWLVDHRPLVAVTSIADPAGHTITASNYLIYSEYGLIESYGVFPRAVRTGGARDRWLVTYTAGLFSTEALVPKTIPTGMLLMVAKWFHNPEPMVQSRREGSSTISYIPNPTAKSIVPPEVDVLWSPWRSRTV